MMAPGRAALALCAAAFAVSSFAGGCVIPDRSFGDPEQTVPLPSTPAEDVPEPMMPEPPIAPEPEPLRPDCQEYCDDVEASCAGPSAVYTSRSQCLAVCTALPAGSPGEMTGNSVACRISRMNMLGFEANLCPEVGPVSTGQCGDSCEAFCALRVAACGVRDSMNLEFIRDDYCEASCSALRSDGAYSVATDESGIRYENADTLECRVGHLTLALEKPELAATECDASRIVPRNQLGPCRDETDAIDFDSDRDTYCSLVQQACVGDLAVYTSLEQCKAVSATFEVGTADDIAANTLRCRRYHAYNAFEDPTTHCTHAGPTGDGTCAPAAERALGNCVSYCRILARACPNDYGDQFAAANAVPLEGCVEECTPLSDSGAGGFFAAPRYTADATQPPDSLKCRTQHAVRALDQPNGPECAAAMGDEDSACGAGLE